MGDDVSEVEARNGRKRRQVAEMGDHPCVEVHYRNLTKESRRRLHAMIEDWSTWQAAHAKLVWEELPLRHLASHDAPAQNSSAFNAEYEEDNAVPAYDRFMDGALGEAVDTSILPKEASRCWNCGSYTHALRDCPRPRDQLAINAAREEQQARGGAGPLPRYHGGMGRDAAKNFEDLKPGSLSAAAREALGIGETAPPPWLQRMREFGYPPGYLGYVASESDLSLAIIDGSESPLATAADDVEEGEMSPEAEDTPPPLLPTPDKPPQPLVLFPGVNAPPPADANLSEWGTQPPPPSRREEWGHPSPPSLEDAREGYGEYRQPQQHMYPPRYPYGGGGGTEYTASGHGYGYYESSQPYVQGRPRLDVPTTAANAAWSLAAEASPLVLSREVAGWNAASAHSHNERKEEGVGKEELPDMDMSD